ncbi:MAG: tetratricopeptide repeat protein, partial [Deltaproteobacteria bacterium]
MDIKYLIIVTLFGASLPALASNDDIKPSTSMTVPQKMTTSKATSRALYRYATARLHVIDGDMDGALALLRDAISEDPESAFLYKKMADIYLKMNRPKEALAACEKALTCDPEYRPAQFLAGVMLAALGRDKEAIPHLKKAMELDLANEDAYINLAVSYVKLFEYESGVN